MQFTLPDHGYGASASRGVPGYVPAFAVTHCAYPRRDGQAELTWVAVYIPRWFTRLQTITHPSTNRARRRLTSYNHQLRKTCVGPARRTLVGVVVVLWLPINPPCHGALQRLPVTGGGRSSSTPYDACVSRRRHPVHPVGAHRNVIARRTDCTHVETRRTRLQQPATKTSLHDLVCPPIYHNDVSTVS